MRRPAVIPHAVRVSPDDLAAVNHSWHELGARRDELAARVAASFDALGAPTGAPACADWLVHAVAELVGLLTAPSQLGPCARELACSWPATDRSPSFRIEGQAWMAAARDVAPGWDARVERAWRHAWLLLSEVLAEESLSPFADDRCRPSTYVTRPSEDT